MLLLFAVGRVAAVLAGAIPLDEAGRDAVQLLGAVRPACISGVTVAAVISDANNELATFFPGILQKNIRLYRHSARSFL